MYADEALNPSFSQMYSSLSSPRFHEEAYTKIPHIVGSINIQKVNIACQDNPLKRIMKCFYLIFIEKETRSGISDSIGKRLALLPVSVRFQRMRREMK